MLSSLSKRPFQGDSLSSLSFQPQRNDKKTDLFVQFMGPLHLQLHSTVLPLPGGIRQRALLAFFLYHQHTPIHRDRIIEQFWPNHDVDCARNNLNVGIYTLRRYLGQFFKGEIILYHNGYFQLHPEVYIHSDLEAFEERYGSGREAERRNQAAEAAGWYRLVVQNGPILLEEFQQENWTREPRRAFLEKYLHALKYMGQYQQEKGEYEAAIDWWRQVAQADVCQEIAHQRLMECFIATGRKEMAARQYRECERALAEKLALSPSSQIQLLRDEVYGR